jgi:hypothetical protein
VNYGDTLFNKWVYDEWDSEVPGLLNENVEWACEVIRLLTDKGSELLKLFNEYEELVSYSGYSISTKW